MINTYGQKMWEHFVKLSKEIKPMKEFEWKEGAEKWRKELEKLKE